MSSIVALLNTRLTYDILTNDYEVAMHTHSDSLKDDGSAIWYPKGETVQCLSELLFFTLLFLLKLS